MDILNQRIMDLSPQKREMLLKRLQVKKESSVEHYILPRTKTSNTFPLSFAQQRLWFFDQLVPNNPVYNVPYALRIQGLLCADLLAQSLNEIVQRHKVLHTTFHVVEGQPTQTIVPVMQCPLQSVDMRMISQDEVEIAIYESISQEIRSPFSMECGPLLRALLIHVKEDEHIFVLTMHHIVSDGWSIGVLFQEFTELYNASCRGVPAHLIDLPIQYADFACWQREQLQGERLQKELTYWTHYLQDAPQQLALPTDHPRPAAQSFQGARVSFMVSATLTRALRLLSQQEETTLFMTLLAAFQTLLYRYSHQQDFLIGTPVANRTQTQLEPLIGFFVNTLVLRACFSDHQCFRDLLQQTRKSTLAAYMHQDLPFERLVEELRPTRDLSYNPLIQTMFSLQNAPMQLPELQNLQLDLLEVECGTTHFDLSLEMQGTSQGLCGHITYSVDLFDRESIVSMTDHFLHVLEGVVTEPDQILWQLPLLSAREQKQLLVEWNDTFTNYPTHQCIHHLFELQVEQTPEAFAVIHNDRCLTYRELNARANQLAHYLQERGVGPEVLVGICVERSLNMIVGLLGILKAGGAYVPLDPHYPQERLLYMTQDSQMWMVLTQEHLVEQFSRYQGLMSCLDTDWQVISQYSEHNCASGAVDNNLAYVIYTSGSTGHPKGVAIEHRNTVALLHWARRIFPQTALSGVLASTSICFDLSVFELFVPLSNGGMSILVENALYLPTLPERHKVTLLNTVPSVMGELLRINGVPDSVQIINLAGEVLSSALVQQVYQQCSVQHVLNLYGPTEDTTYSTFAVIQRNALQSPAIGRPIDNTRVYILDTHLQPMPVGIPGELYIAGAGLAREYLNQPVLTREKFIADPLSSAHEARIYKTGDIARYRRDGSIEFLGRIDQQVKLRGFRIEPGEIEVLLRQYKGIQDVVIRVRKNTDQLVCLVAYLILEPHTSLSEIELHNYLRRHLPDYMVPAAFLFLDTFPLTPNKKVDDNALPLPDFTAISMKSEENQPRSNTEEVLASIYAQLLGIEHIGLHDSFFEMGGHSLLATQLVMLIYDAFHVDIPLTMVFDAPTIEEMALYVDNTLKGTS